MSEIHDLILNNATALSVLGIPYPDEHFTFEEIIGTTLVEKKWNGTVMNGGQIVPGIVGNAIEFNEINYEYVEFGPLHEPCFDNMDLCTEGLTLTFWSNTIYTAHTMSAIALGCGKQEDRQGLRFDFASGMVFISVRFSDEYQVGVYALNPPTGWLHHGVIAKKGQHLQYVLNGTVQGAMINNLGSGPATLGGSVRMGTLSEELILNSYEGKLDDVRLWKKAKCPEFVRYIYDMYRI